MAKQSTTGQRSPAAKGSRSAGMPQGSERPASQPGEQGRATQSTKDQAQMTRQGSAAADRIIAESAIAERAYEIWRSQGGSDLDNWLRAERELRDQSGARARAEM